MLRDLGVVLRGLCLLLGLGLPLLEFLVGVRLGGGALLLDLLVGGPARFGDRLRDATLQLALELCHLRAVALRYQARVVRALLSLLGCRQRFLFGPLRALGGRAGAVHPGLDRIAHRSGILDGRPELPGGIAWAGRLVRQHARQQPRRVRGKFPQAGAGAVREPVKWTSSWHDISLRCEGTLGGHIAGPATR